MKLDKLIEWVDCRKDCSCHGHEAARRFRLAVEALKYAKDHFINRCRGRGVVEESRSFQAKIREIEGSE